jgi:hypothetical protein
MSLIKVTKVTTYLHKHFTFSFTFIYVKQLRCLTIHCAIFKEHKQTSKIFDFVMVA